MSNAVKCVYYINFSALKSKRRGTFHSIFKERCIYESRQAVEKELTCSQHENVVSRRIYHQGKLLE